MRPFSFQHQRQQNNEEASQRPALTRQKTDINLNSKVTLPQNLSREQQTNLTDRHGARASTFVRQAFSPFPG